MFQYFRLEALSDVVSVDVVSQYEWYLHKTILLLMFQFHNRSKSIP